MTTKPTSRLSRGFRKRARSRGRVLIARYGATEAAKITDLAIAHYDELVPEIEALPKGLLYASLAGTYEYLAYVKAMQAHGATAEEIGSFFSESYDELIKRFPKWLGPLVFRVARPFLRAKLKKDAAASAAAPDGGWRFDYIEPAPGSHDIGIDVTSCAVCALYRRHEVEELVPYLCALDDKMSETLGMGLRREGTRALGASCCDFRYRAGGKPKPLASSGSLPVISS